MKAQDAFESSPKASLIRYESRLWQSGNSDIKDILARLESAPRGTRLMMLDYILLCNSDEGDCFKDDGEQPNVFVAFANVAAVYNAGAITNGLVYRQAGAFLWIAAVAVSVTFAKGHGSSLADSHLRPVTLEFSSRYMQGSFHQYLKTLGYEPFLLVLDEPTSSTDTITEKNLFQHISNDCRNQTIILVSHSVDTIKIAAKIFVVDEGKIIADGTHHELLRKCQTYATLFLKE
ncbi:hypothetical protein [Mobiluncus mulieris]|uniref:hypothetical protein n=1 Tax=Mobiluncus mulieris TaxID=2052 RepID=UPI001C499090|nr:hypothetical protein [Mobiluncus mulieris]